jgi:hypothetical protein
VKPAVTARVLTVKLFRTPTPKGWLTLRSIAAGVLLRSDGHDSHLIRRCDEEFSTNPTLLGYLDTAFATLRS